MNAIVDKSTMLCRAGCGACCIAPSINSFIPGMPNGKPAGTRCIQLTGDNYCKLFGKPERPLFCTKLKSSLDMCGSNRNEAMLRIDLLEQLTKP
jgi:Fe-S-cluster containining protein